MCVSVNIYINIYIWYTVHTHNFFHDLVLVVVFVVVGFFFFPLRKQHTNYWGANTLCQSIEMCLKKNLLLTSFRHLAFLPPHANPFKIFIATLSTLGLSHFMQCCVKQSNYKPPERY